MKFVAFRRPIENWDGLDWIYNLMEDKKFDYDFLLITAPSAAKARDLAIEEFYSQSVRAGGKDYIIEDAFDGFTALEYEDDELLEYLGPEDGKTALEFYKKYSWDAFFEDEIRFYKNFDVEDRKKFLNFKEENLKKLYQTSTRYSILLLPVTKEIKYK